MCFLKVQCDNIIMSPGFSLGNKVYDKNVSEIELDGKKVMAEMSPITNIITDMFPKPIAKTLVVKHSSKADKLNVRCLMLDDFNIEIEVENNTYYLIEDQDIIGMYG